jgi:chitinase
LISRYTRAVVNPHTNITEISNGLDLLWRNSIPSNKVVLGLGFYGRSFTLADASCKTPGCAFSSGGEPGKCTDTSGVLSNAEINRIIDEKKLTPTFDQKAGVKWITWDSNQWVSYDDADTLKIKADWANKLGLGGLSKS